MVVDVGRKERKGGERRRERKKAGRMDGEESFVRMNLELPTDEPACVRAIK